ncbi:MAG: DegT/DnrJ/EryC1/StrS family aminotransferase [Syntrophobacteraceae bacterium]
MLTLQPTENWEYGLSDVIKGLAAALGREKINGSLPIPRIGDCIPVRSGRAGIVAALRALDLPAGARVAVPLYCCPAVFKAVRAAGCSLCFIDVEPETYCMSAEDLHAKASQVDAVIAVHMFGNTCDMDGLKDAAQGKPFIEDCAQSLGSRINGRMAGSLGMISVFSFRSGKYLSVGEGGAVFSSDTLIYSRLRSIIAGMPSHEPRAEYMHVLVTYVRSLLRSTPLYGILGHRIWRLYNKRVDFTAQTPVIQNQIYRADFVHTISRLALLGSAIEKQRANADHYMLTLNLDPGMLCPEKPGAFYNRFMFPILFPSTEMRDRIAAYLYQRQIDTSQPYKNIAVVAAAHYGYSGDCPKAEQVAQRVIVIPSHYRLKPGVVQSIAQCVKNGIKQL